MFITGSNSDSYIFSREIWQGQSLRSRPFKLSIGTQKDTEMGFLRVGNFGKKIDNLRQTIEWKKEKIWGNHFGTSRKKVNWTFFLWLTLLSLARSTHTGGHQSEEGAQILAIGRGGRCTRQSNDNWHSMYKRQKSSWRVEEITHFVCIRVKVMALFLPLFGEGGGMNTLAEI